MRINPRNTLEFNVILDQLAAHAVSDTAKQRISELEPFLSENRCRHKMEETTEARKILESFGTPPLSSMKDLPMILALAEKGSMLVPQQLYQISTFISSCKRMSAYLKKAEALFVSLAAYGSTFQDLSALYEEIDRCIRNEAVDDSASSDLRSIRRKLEFTKTSVRDKLESMLRSKKEWFSDGYVATRNGRLTLPVKREYKNQVKGAVIDTSGSGGTFFIEPSSVGKLQEELSLLQIQEENEVRRILYTLTSLVESNSGAIKINMECMEVLDFAFAKAKLSLAMGAIPVEVNADRRIKIVKGRHPLLDQGQCVPLDFEIGDGISGVIITGPNTGGKTVALKTVGLLSLMAQSGLHVPAAEGSVFCMNDMVLCDIGDGQSITENLSTFSSHLTNILEILNNATNESLVLLDELGTGTDPAEGMGIAIAVLDELRQKGCLFLATTHYPEIKEFARKTRGLVNARMEFDRDSLQPLYRLRIGEAGESCALYIAQRLGFPGHLLNRARREAYSERNKSTSQNQYGEFDEVPSPEKPESGGKIRREVPKRTEPRRSERFNIGDSVTVYPQKAIGIVYQPANEKGELGVQIKGKKQLINHKRVKLHTPASELYPPDYDFSIIFDSVENRKARHQMEKKHHPDLVIKYD